MTDRELITPPLEELTADQQYKAQRLPRRAGLAWAKKSRQPQKKKDRWLTIAEIAELLKLSEWTIKTYVRQGLFRPVYRLSPGSYRIRYADFESSLARLEWRRFSRRSPYAGRINRTLMHQLRWRKGLTQEEASTLATLRRRRDWGAMERGTAFPTEEELRRIAEVLDCQAEELLLPEPKTAPRPRIPPQKAPKSKGKVETPGP